MLQFEISHYFGGLRLKRFLLTEKVFNFVFSRPFWGPMVARKPFFQLFFIYVDSFESKLVRSRSPPFHCEDACCKLFRLLPNNQPANRLRLGWLLCEYLFEVLFRLVRFVSKAFADQISFASSGRPVLRIFMFSDGNFILRLPLCVFVCFFFFFFGGRRG